ncbi:HelD family protein [Streptosporangium sp. NPDC087985]|uniref:HelD family protein n=1 Tax=Streptosporangium sp. NPDC087985 TaxID=3366196 RepID=UPI003810F750
MGSADRAIVIAEEQRAVDHAYDCVELRQLDADRVRSTRGAEHPDTGLPFVADVPPEFGVYEDLGEQPLVFMRVDVTGDPEGPETWRIGRRAVRDPDGGLVVINWTTAQAITWMKAQPSRPDGIRLRRKLRLDGRTVTDYLDDIRPVAPRRSATMPVPDAVPLAEELPFPAPEQAPGEPADAFLLADLDRARDGLMRDIVETIQRDQLELVSDGRPGVLIVQGGPGTGKTAVGLHRVVWLLDPTNRGLAPDDVLVVGPHRGFLRYVSQVLPRLGSRGVATVEVARLWEGEVRAIDTPQAHLVKSDERMAEVLRRVVESGVRPEALAAHVGDDVFSTPYRGAALTLPATEIEALAVAARDSNGPYLVRRRKFVDTFVDRLMHRYAKALPGRRPDRALRSGIEKHSRVASLINAIWPATNAETVLRRTLNDPDLIGLAAPGLLTAEERAAVVRPRTARGAEEPWTLDDLVCLEELRHLLSGARLRRYRHIVVDEAQDLTPMQARSLARRCPSGSMTVLGDLAQTTGARQYDVWERLAVLLSGGDGWHMAELAVGYRVPDEVMRFAAPLAATVSLSTAVPRSVRPADETSLRIVPAEADRLADEAVERALDLATADREQGRSVALIVPDGTALLGEIGARVTAAQGEVPENDVPPLVVLPATMARGLEFDHVVVVEPAAIAAQGAAGPRRLYVAITRCTQSLTVVHSAPLPVELGGPAGPVPANAPEPPSTSSEENMTMESDLPSGGGPLPDGDPAPDDDLLSGGDPLPDGDPTPGGDPIPGGDPHDHDFQSFVSSLEERVRADRQCHVHEELRFRLIAELHGARLHPAQSSLVDIACKGPEGSARYEVLGEGGHTYERMREAVLRIMEVEHAGGDRADHLFLVLPQAPEPSWAPGMLATTFNITTIWRDGTGWGGERLAVALGQTPAAEPAPQ